MKTLSERLRAAMNLSGMTQAALAEASGVAQPTIYKILSGKTQHSAYVVQIAKALQVSPFWLAMGEGAMRDNDEVIKEGKNELDMFKILPVWDGDNKTKDMIPIPEDIYNDSCSAFLITSETGFPGIKKGAIVLVDKKKRIENGDYVYVKSGEAYNLFSYVSSGVGGYLSSSDPRVPLAPLTDGLNIMGVVTYLSMKAK